MFSPSIFLIFSFVHICFCDDIFENVAKFCQNNGYKYVTFTNFDSKMDFLNLSKRTFAAKLRIRVINSNNDANDISNSDMMVYVIH